jgi:hypothetical protein
VDLYDAFTIKGPAIPFTSRTDRVARLDPVDDIRRHKSAEWKKSSALKWRVCLVTP